MKVLLLGIGMSISLIISVACGPGGMFAMILVGSILLAAHVAHRCRSYTRR